MKECNGCAFPEVMTVEQAAEYIQVSRAKMDQLIACGDVAARNINEGGTRKIYRISKTALDDWLLANRETQS